MTDPTPEVTIAGGGIAGMTAALALLRAGFSVKVIEASGGLGGKFGARYARSGYHDFAWHILAEWCTNFWHLAESIGLRKSVDFEEQPTVSFLRPRRTSSAWPRVASVSCIGSPDLFWKNAASGVAHWSDIVLYTYSLYSLLCDQDLAREEFLNRTTVNGYMRSLPHMSDMAAVLHNELLLRIWAIPSYLISARSYQTHLQVVAPYASSTSSIVVLKKNLAQGFWEPFHRALEAFGPRFTFVPNAALTGIRLAPAGDRVGEITVQHGRESAPRAERVNSLIVAIPPHQLQRVLSHPDSRALRRRAPGLLDVSKLTTQQTSSLTLYLKRRIDIPGVNQEPVALIDDPETLYTPDARAQRNGLASEYGISFIEVGKLWGADHPMVLSVLASDAESLKLLDEDEACQNVIGVLRQYLDFEDADIDWAYSYYQPHRGDGLFVNTVGSWEYRPEVRLADSDGKPLTDQIWKTVPNLYLAGDYCRSQIDFVSVEGAMHTGLWAARALSLRARGAGRPGDVVPAPLAPAKFDRELSEQLRARLARWAGLASRRSRLEEASSRALASGHASSAESSRPHAATASHHNSARSDEGAAMSDAMSTYPGFRSPFNSADTKWLSDKKFRLDDTVITLTGSGAMVPVPLVLWETQALCIDGLADANSVDALERFRAQGLRARHVDPGNFLMEEPGSERAHVQIWAANYGGTTIGPIKAVYAAIDVEARRSCTPRETDADLLHMWWWWYYGDSALNQEFKHDVWGIPNDRAAIEMLYLTDTKEVRLLEKGGLALRLRCNTDPKRVLRKGDPKTSLPFRTVAPLRPPGADENGVELINYGDILASPPREKASEFFHCVKGTTIDQLLSGVGFEPISWTFCSGYNGIVKIYDAKGAGIPPQPPGKEVTKVELTGDAANELRQFLRIAANPRNARVVEQKSKGKPKSKGKGTT